VHAYLASVAFLLRHIKELLTPHFRYGTGDPRITRLEQARTAGGLVITFAVLIAYEQTGYDAVMGSLGNVMVNAAMAMPALVIGIGILLITTAAPDRPRLVRAMRRPALTLLACLAAGLAFDFILGNYKSTPGAAMTTIVTLAIILALLLYVMPAILWTAYWSYRYWFNAADGHPLLPAVCSIVYSLGILGYHTYLLAAGNLEPRIPGPLALLFTFGSPLAVITLAILEINLSHRTGTTLRTLPPTQP
jgi:uncharacterized membrane protein YidH (DUF202 family)